MEPRKLFTVRKVPVGEPTYKVHMVECIRQLLRKRFPLADRGTLSPDGTRALSSTRPLPEWPGRAPEHFYTAHRVSLTSVPATCPLGQRNGS